MINFYRRHLPKAAGTLEPLTRILGRQQARGSNAPITWSEEQDGAFRAAKALLAARTLLAYPIMDGPLLLRTDASDVAIGGVLEQKQGGHPRPLAFFSRILKPAEKRYSVFDRELLALHQSVRHFRHFLEGNAFVALTDHRPLVSSIRKRSDSWTDRQRRQLSELAEYCMTLEYQAGVSNVVADCLSRVQLTAEVHQVQIGVDFRVVAEAQTKDPEIPAYRTSVTGLKWEDIDVGGIKLLCDVSTGRPRPLLPRELRRLAFDTVHGLGHPSIRTTVKAMKSKYVWHGIGRDVARWARTCLHCQQSKVHRHTRAPLQQFPPPSRRFGHIHVDVVGPLPESGGFSYLFTLTERTTRWPVAVPIFRPGAQECAAALLHHWVAAFGVPADITSDRGGSFVAEVWEELAKLMGSNTIRTCAYRPSSNGMAERTHRSLKAALRARCLDGNWFHHLPWILLALRTAPKDGIGVSPAEMVYGVQLVVPGEFFPSSGGGNIDEEARKQLQRARDVVRQLRPFPITKENAPASYVHPALKNCKQVFVRVDSMRPTLSRPYQGPYRVLEKRDKYFRVQLRDRVDNVSIDRLKPAYTESDVGDCDHPDRVTRAGRISRPPVRFNYV